MIQNQITKTSNPVDPVLEAQKRYCRQAMLLAFFLGLFLIFCGYKPAGKGLVLGTLFSVINFIIMGYAIPKSIGKSKGQILKINMGSLTVRMMILAIPFYIALNSTAFSLGTTVAGVFMVQVVILMDNALFPNLLLLFKKDRVSGEL